MQYFFISVSEYGKLSFGGTNNLVDTLVQDVELMSKIREHVLLNSSNGPHIHTVIPPFEYNKLPCSPYSKNWKGSAKIRKILRDMLKIAGYGKAGSKTVLGVGAPPYGWPKKYNWKD